MLKAGALYYAILVSFLVALLSGFLMINIRFHHYHTITILQSQRLERDINSALLLARETPASVNDNQTIITDLFDNGEDEVSITRKNWGGFVLFKAEAFWQKVYHSKIEMCGTDVFCDEPIALYLADKERYLSISGKTNLNGNCYLPKLGIRRAYIEGASYIGEELVHGKIENSKANLPDIEPLFLAANQDYFKSSRFSNDSLLTIGQLLTYDTIVNSFYNKTIVFYSEQWLNLTKKILRGNVKIVSSKGITIGKTSETQDIIIYAPKIEVESGFSGAIQMFAKDTIIIREGTKLLFPSLITIMNADIKKPILEIEKGCKISGDIVLHTIQNKPDIQAECKIDEECTINGRIYCNGKLHLLGCVNGSVYCNGFILQTPASLYENHLLNVTIDFKSLSKYYSGATLFKVADRYKAIKWMN